MARDQDAGPEMSLGEHLAELRKRLIYALVGLTLVACVCLYFGDVIMNVVKAPVVEALKQTAPDPKDPNAGKLYAITVMEGFTAYIKVSLIAALFFGCPWVLYQFWRFVAAGLYPREKKYVYMLVPFTAGLFLTGVVFSYFVLVRYGVQYLVQFTRDLNVTPIFTLDSTLMFVLLLSLVMGLVFQLPLVMLLLTKIGVIRAQTFARKRKFAIVSAIVLAAFITPTQDAFNLTLCTVPLIALYEIGIIVCRLAERGKAKPAEPEEDEPAG